MSEYSTREVFRSHALLEVHPVTGRTHQVRLHCAYLGCPVVGDKVYGLRKPTISLDRHFLHAWKIKLMLPAATEMREFTAELPDDLKHTLETLRIAARAVG